MTSTPSKSEPDWYEVVQNGGLEQGDILPHCLVHIVAESDDQEGGQVEVDVETRDLIVLTQTCDLVQDKLRQVLLVQVWTWEAVVSARKAQGDLSFGSTERRRQLQRGQLPNMCLLHRRSGDPSLAWSVVDFHELYVLPKARLMAHASKLGPRLRLRPPYKEHLAQAFARYFMRVGLPHDASSFVTEGGGK